MKITIETTYKIHLSNGKDIELTEKEINELTELLNKLHGKPTPSTTDKLELDKVELEKEETDILKKKNIPDPFPNIPDYPPYPWPWIPRDGWPFPGDTLPYPYWPWDNRYKIITKDNTSPDMDNNYKDNQTGNPPNPYYPTICHS